MPAIFLLLSGCGRNWDYPNTDSLASSLKPLDPENCSVCHQENYDTWKKNAHSVTRRMGIIPAAGQANCHACHGVLPEGAGSACPSNMSNPGKLSKGDQNRLCGRCHYNKEVFGWKAINPRDRHGMFLDVGFEGRKKQVSCLECHTGHQGRSAMLRNIKAHACFRCHKEAIATMGVFQPVNYLAFGKACQACHTIHGGSTAYKNTRMGTGVCIVCHYSTTTSSIIPF
jgi:predicted CXXCH cytochrome family protein